MTPDDFKILKARIVSSMDFSDEQRAFVLAAIDRQRTHTATVVYEREELEVMEPGK